MALRDQILDAAVSAAKEFGHERVEPRHVLFAIARRFRARPDVAALLAGARAELEPRGMATVMPEVSAEAAELLVSITTEAEAVAALVAAFSGRPSAASQAAAQVRVAQTEPHAQPAAPAAAPGGPRQETTAEILAELDALVGLAAVKAQVKNVIAVVEANAARARAGLPQVNPSLHLVFTGPPGTGKTTVARLIARLYAATGALPGSGFTEAARADLIAGYVGQTALKTMEVINKTRPGVLFIDEAYALTPSSGVDFGAEAIATLVKAMEDLRGELALIVAGYGDEMADFVASNPGLRSRFKTYIEFPDYSAAELLAIFERFVAEADIALGAGVRERAARVLADAVGHRAFGNARFVRSLFEQAFARMAARAAADGRVSISELRELAPDDVVLDADALERETRRIGFGRE